MALPVLLNHTNNNFKFEEFYDLIDMSIDLSVEQIKSLTITDTLTTDNIFSYNKEKHYVKATENPSTNNLTLPRGSKDDFSSNYELIVEGYCSISAACCGILLNFCGVCFILRKSQRNKLFNMLLLPLLGFDSTFIIGESIKALDRYFLTMPSVYKWYILNTINIQVTRSQGAPPADRDF